MTITDARASASRTPEISLSISVFSLINLTINENEKLLDMFFK